jgi:gamma-glutamyltranspeptidase
MEMLKTYCRWGTGYKMFSRSTSPNWISQTSSSGSASYEEGFDEDVLQELRDLEHSVHSTPSVIGSVQAVVVDLKNGQQFGGADSRRAGTVIGLPRKKDKKANKE